MKIQLNPLQQEVLMVLSRAGRLLPDDFSGRPMNPNKRKAVTEALKDLTKIGLVDEELPTPELSFFHPEYRGRFVYCLKRTTQAEWWLMAAAVELPAGIEVPVITNLETQEVTWQTIA